MEAICLVNGGYVLGEFCNPVEALEFRDFMRASNPEGSYRLMRFE